jgi:hypothetical protein
MAGGWLSGLCYFTLIVVTLLNGLRYVAVDTPWRPIYIAVYAVFLGIVAESVIIDSDHWRHFFLLLGVQWGLMIATRRWLTDAAELGDQIELDPVPESIEPTVESPAGLVPEPSPDAPSESVPELVSESLAETSSAPSTGASTEASGELSSELAPAVVSEPPTVPETLPEMLPPTLPEVAPALVPEHTPEKLSEAAPEPIEPSAKPA